MSKVKWVIKRIVGIAMFTWIMPFMWMVEWVVEDESTVNEAMQKTWKFYKEEALGIKPKKRVY
jgi:ABC-type glycerol-3-phosphate transport system permease component